VALALRLHLSAEGDLTFDECVDALQCLQVLHRANLVVLFGEADLPHELVDPYVHLRTGSLWIDLIVNSDHSRVAEVLGLLGLTISGTPWLAALPQRVRERWYREALLAEQAKHAYDELHSLGRVEVTDHQTTAPTSGRTRRRRTQRQQVRRQSRA
jgi:hypothetical protein